MSTQSQAPKKVQRLMGKPQAKPQSPKPAKAIPSFDELPDSALVRIYQLVVTRGKPGTTVILPFSESTLWRRVKKNTFPQPVKLGEQITAWRVSDVRRWMRMNNLAPKQ